MPQTLTMYIQHRRSIIQNTCIPMQFNYIIVVEYQENRHSSKKQTDTITELIALIFPESDTCFLSPVNKWACRYYKCRILPCWGKTSLRLFVKAVRMKTFPTFFVVCFYKKRFCEMTRGAILCYYSIIWIERHKRTTYHATLQGWTQRQRKFIVKPNSKQKKTHMWWSTSSLPVVIGYCSLANAFSSLCHLFEGHTPALQ